MKKYLFDKTTFMEEHYATRVLQFENEPVKTGVIIFLGDSITECGELHKRPRCLIMKMLLIAG